MTPPPGRVLVVTTRPGHSLAIGRGPLSDEERDLLGYAATLMEAT